MARIGSSMGAPMTGSSQEHQRCAKVRVKSVRCAVLTVSDTRTADDDEGGPLVERLLGQHDHEIVARAIVPDEPVEIAARLDGRGDRCPDRRCGWGHVRVCVARVAQGGGAGGDGTNRPAACAPGVASVQARAVAARSLHGYAVPRRSMITCPWYRQPCNPARKPVTSSLDRALKRAAVSLRACVVIASAGSRP